jgi:endonuclease/exonuclease/phosphatase family metal-dependent hydrolase
VFFYDRYFLNVMPLTPTFFENIHGLEDGRRAQLDRLLADIGANPHSLLASGNFNVLPNTGDRSRLRGLKDAGRADRSIYPTSLTFFGLPLWRMDWTFTSTDVGVHRYDLIPAAGLSSRHPQDVVVSLHSS